MCLDKFWSVKPFWILNLRKVITFSIFVCRKFAWLYKNLCLLKPSLTKETFLFAENFFVYKTFIWSIKILLQEPFLFLENIYDREKFSESSLTVEKFLASGKFPELWKVYRDKVIKENLLSWLQKKE